MSNDFIRKSVLDKTAASWSSALDCIAHDLIGHLAIIRLKKNMLTEILPPLLKGYNLAIEHNLMEPEVKSAYLRAITDIANLDDQITGMTNFLTLVNRYSAQLIATAKTSQILSASFCVTELLENYPFESAEQQKLINFNKNFDFQFQCASIFIEALLNNLLTNALTSIKAAGKGEITIWLEDEGDYFSLHFKDTGLGMSEESCAHVFERFFSKRDHKTVPGLGFCSLAIAHAGGEVICNSQLNEHTHFIIRFSK